MLSPVQYCASGGSCSVIAVNVSHGSSQKTENVPRVGKYSILKTLEKGKFGTVKLAVHVPTGEQVAIKEIDKTKTGKFENLFREAQNMKTLDHPNIIKLLQVIETKKSLYLIMEYAEGGDIFTYLRSGRMQESEAREKFRQIVSAVHYCHQKQIIHRDLKSENILLDSKNNVKLADFGLSREFVRGDHLETYCGTFAYQAPEIFQRKEYEGPEIDVWSLGVILYELVTDNVPFGDSSATNTKKRVLRGKYRIPSYVSTKCKNLIKKMLVLDPLQRASIDAIMKDEWFNIDLEEEEAETKLSPKKPTFYAFNQNQIEMLTEMGYKQQEVEISLQAATFDDCYASRFLVGQNVSNSTKKVHLPDVALIVNNGIPSVEVNATTMQGDLGRNYAQTESVSSHSHSGNGEQHKDDLKINITSPNAPKQSQTFNSTTSIRLTPPSLTSWNNVATVPSIKQQNTIPPQTSNKTTASDGQISNLPTSAAATTPSSISDVPPFSTIHLLTKMFQFHRRFITR